MINEKMIENLFGENKQMTAEDRRKILIDHIKRRPIIDAKFAPLRLKRWQKWRTQANLDAHDTLNIVPPFVCHDLYSDKEKKIFRENKINFCPGNCNDKCLYLLNKSS